MRLNGAGAPTATVNTHTSGCEDEIRRYYEAAWKTRRPGDLVLIKSLLYTGVRVGEIVAIRLGDVDFDRFQIRINEGKGRKDRVVPFPTAFKETLALHHDRLRQRGASYLFESSWKKPYSDRGVRRLLERYATAAGLPQPISPHRLRHFLLTWLKKQGIDDALIQPYSGHASPFLGGTVGFDQVIQPGSDVLAYVPIALRRHDRAPFA
jgi:integrase/recombinase XerD